MTTHCPVVIIGAGHAGFQLAAALRQEGFAQSISLLNDERHLPYQRPPLSKSFLKARSAPESLTFRPAAFFGEKNIHLVADHVVAIDRGLHKVRLRSGASLDYGHLVLATGARNRLLDIPNAGLKAVRYLRTLDESEALREYLMPGRRVVVIGAGFIGLEFAATARNLGLEVDVVELAGRVMSRVVTAEISEYFHARHVSAGIRIHYGVQATGIEAVGDRLSGVSLSDGRHISADFVVVGAGVLPNVELAAEAGLSVASGIKVDAYLSTSDPDISAIGDCALYESRRFGGSLRLESVQNATEHAKCVAARLTGNPQVYAGLPWFWSDQGEDKLQIVGLTTGYDQVVMRGNREHRRFSAFCFRDGSLISIESINSAGDHMFGRRLFESQLNLTPTQANDLTFDLKDALGRSTT